MMTTTTYRDDFTDYLDNYNHLCAHQIREIWVTWHTEQPESPLPVPQCGPCEEGTGMQLVIRKGTRVLQLDVWADGGEVFWRDGDDCGGDEGRRQDWQKVFASSLPWLLDGTDDAVSDL